VSIVANIKHKTKNETSDVNDYKNSRTSHDKKDWRQISNLHSHYPQQEMGRCYTWCPAGDVKG